MVDCLDTWSEYQKNYVDLPEDITKEQTVEYLRWQKERNKLQRDFYLSLSCLLAQLFLFTASHWIDKYNRFVEFVEREKKAR